MARPRRAPDLAHPCRRPTPLSLLALVALLLAACGSATVTTVPTPIARASASVAANATAGRGATAQSSPSRAASAPAVVAGLCAIPVAAQRTPTRAAPVTPTVAKPLPSPGSAFAPDAAPQRTIDVSEYGVRRFAYTPDGATIVMASGEKVRLLDVASGREKRSFVVSDRSIVESFARSADGRFVAVIIFDRVALWYIATG